MQNTKVIINLNNSKITTDAFSLGISTNKQDFSDFIKHTRFKSSFVPLINIKNSNSNLTFNQNLGKLNIQKLLPKEINPPINASFSTKDNKIIIINSQNGKSINLYDYKEFIIKQILEGQNYIEFNAKLSDNIEPFTTTDELQKYTNLTEEIYNKSYKLLDDNRTYSINPALIKLNLTENSKLSITSNDAKEIIIESTNNANLLPINQVTTTFKSGKQAMVTQDSLNGKKINNYDDLSNLLISAVNNRQDLIAKLYFDEIASSNDTILLDDTNRLGTLKYKVSSWGDISNVSISEFSKLVGQTLNDGRGWALTGITFEQVTINEDFEIVLSEANEIARRYPNICDNIYSCRVGRYVIVNVDRWNNATPVWTLSLRDYRHLVVNHEVGHLLGLGHPICPSAGTLAPAMLQQSINLQGCIFNPWPLQNEITLAQNKWNR